MSGYRLERFLPCASEIDDFREDGLINSALINYLRAKHLILLVKSKMLAKVSKVHKQENELILQQATLMFQESNS